MSSLLDFFHPKLSPSSLLIKLNCSLDSWAFWLYTLCVLFSPLLGASNTSSIYLSKKKKVSSIAISKKKASAPQLAPKFLLPKSLLQHLQKIFFQRTFTIPSIFLELYPPTITHKETSSPSKGIPHPNLIAFHKPTP